MSPLRIAAVSLLLLFPATLWAGGFTIIEVGSQKTGMMTGIGKPDDLSAVYHNPAGLADQHGTLGLLLRGRHHPDAGLGIRRSQQPKP